ncbi:CRISPR-associated helicase Cas3 [Desulfurella amilsii]|uniref:CRISPR-associated helicase Cas3 n=1 Tax=Desulfurella amilsii TaxID=1562698 RepID=A0A1X4XVF2_9BACT|nr:CRISPR-associated helicase/endonuclease Cas3 [Desulfurella amilsii]OSS41510.1 CRISPR-associated helicase Cas3 [Desulfurella amilsii]
MEKLLDKYYAKSDPPITIFQHNEDLKYRFRQLEPYLPEDKVKRYKDIIYKIIEYHDFGKINKKFQNKIKNGKKEQGEMPHEWLSIAFIDKKLENWLKTFNDDNINFYTLFCYIIANHHTRNKELLVDLAAKLKDAIIKDIPEDIPEDMLDTDYDINKDFNEKVNEYFTNYFTDLIFLKGILHKCDYSASAGIDVEQRYIGNYQTDFINGLKSKNITLKPFQSNAKNLSDKNVILVASTGMGKTEYSMSWINGNKVFYLLGIKIAVNAMYERFKNFFNNNVSLLHGDINYQLLDETDGEKDYEFKLAKIRQFSYPVTIATADQLITSVFKFNGFELHYLTASYSKIIVDEIQSFSPETIACIVVFLQEVSRLGAKFLIMSATIPPFIKDEFQKIACLEEPQLSEERRHKIEIKDYFIENYDFSSVDFNNKKVLIICNTVKKAQSIYEKLKERSVEANLLHARFTKLDKARKEKDILKFANSNNTGVWITTQIVEASLDIDFDLLLTECSTIDSMLQRFGRCYRKRDYCKITPNILIFRYDDISKKIYDAELLERTHKALSKYNGSLLTEKQKQEMINEVFSDIESTKYYQSYSDYKQLLKSGFRTGKVESQELFRKITNEYTVIPEPVYKSNETLINEYISNIDSSKGIKRLEQKEKLFNYCIELHYTELQVFNKHRLLPITIKSNFLRNSGIKILTGVSYDDKEGLKFINDSEKIDNVI